ncbi:MAG TPA: zinc ABC transporter substrate-binding protein [Clostridia bacterium]
MKKTIYYLLCLALIVSFAFSFNGCGKEQDQGVKVYTSFYTLYDFASKIAQDKAKVYNIMPSGADAHSWTPSAKDLVNLNKADIFIYNGLGMEHWTDQVLKILDKKVLTVRVSEGVEAEKHDHDHEHNEAADPHIWLSPLNAKIILKNIKDALVKADSQNADFYEQNYEYCAALCDELYNNFIDLKDFEKRDVVVTKNAFYYLCEAFDLKQTALTRSHSSEPSLGKVAEIVEYIIDNDVKVIFSDAFSVDTAQAIKKEAANEGKSIETAVLNPLEALSEKDLKEGKDYFKIMEDNLNAVKNALKKQNGLS